MSNASVALGTRTERQSIETSGPQASGSDHRLRTSTLTPRSILVATPSLMHSHQLSLALHEQNLLKAYWCGVPVVAPEESFPFWMPERARRKIRRIDIPASLRAHPLRFQLCLRGTSALVPAALLGHPGDFNHRVFHWFDAWTAKRIERLKPQVVIAYENSAYHTFAAAKAVGATCVLDAASYHHQTAAELWPQERSPFEAEINRRKDAEANMADLILTCSPLAAASYVDHGFPAARVRPVLLGAELPDNLQQRTRRDGPPRFIFAGALSRRKSVDLILSAFQRLAAEGLAYELQFVGGMADPTLLTQLRATPSTLYHPSMAQRDLYPLMAQADCLLLPSRFDSFGMTVAEAMACGTPALVSTRTGSRAIIDDAPGSGWIVEPDVEDLYRQLRDLLLTPGKLANARPLALRAAQSYTWAAYRRRAAKLLSEALS